MTADEHGAARSADLARILASTHPRRVVVAGPGTGKSFLFAEIIKKARAGGHSRFLAITFMGKLCDSLADDLCGLAETSTVHGLARRVFLDHMAGWDYYPDIKDVIEADLTAEGITGWTVGDANYRRWTNHYKAVGDADVVFYATSLCKKHPEAFPEHDLVLVDEYQDFNEHESAFIDWIADRVPVVIVGDDDQALYVFKGSSPGFIREKFDAANGNWESHTLRFCSRCPDVIVKYFHALVAQYGLNGNGAGDARERRIEKEYICFLPADQKGKNRDSAQNPKVELVMDCPAAMIPTRIRFALEALVKTQPIKDVLVIGEARSCKAILGSIATRLSEMGFRSVNGIPTTPHLEVEPDVRDAYQRLATDETSALGWRLLGNPTDAKARKQHLTNAKTLNVLRTGTASERRKVTPTRMRALDAALIEAKEDEDGSARVAANEALRTRVLTETLRGDAGHIPRPLVNLDITVCSILGSKGLGADVVFLVGFDEGKLPATAAPEDSEVYQMLVAITRAKKRLYLINSVGHPVSPFATALEEEWVSAVKVNV